MPFCLAHTILSLYDGKLPITALPNEFHEQSLTEEQKNVFISNRPISEASSSDPPSPRPPPFSSLYFPSPSELQRIQAAVTEAACESLLSSAPAPSFEETLAEDEAECKAAAESKAALPRDTKGSPLGKSVDDNEPPPPYTEGSSPLESFTYVMAAAGGAASIITQVQQTGGPPVNALGGWFKAAIFLFVGSLTIVKVGDAGSDEHITLDLRYAYCY